MKDTNHTIPTAPGHGEHRSEYRLKYPAHLRPLLRTGRYVAKVLDISEHGLRCSLEKQTKPVPGERCIGTVTFHDASSASITGDIVRVTSQDGAASLEKGFEFRTIAAEHDLVSNGKP